MRKKICIGTPYITSDEKNATLNCNIRYPDETAQAEDAYADYLMQFHVPVRYRQYLVTERSDAFIAAVLPKAMANGYDIESEIAMSERMYFQLTTTLIPAIDNYMPEWQGIEINAPLDSAPLNGKDKTGLAFSGGGDAFYSLKLTSQTNAEHYRPDFLVFFKISGPGFKVAKEKNNIRAKRVHEFAKEYHYRYMTISSNLRGFLKENNIHVHTYRAVANVLAVQKLFGVFYYSSGVDLCDFEITYRTSSAYDILTLPSFSTQDTQFYSGGVATPRLNKIQAISEFEPTYAHLDACVQKRELNCDCEKCKRTRLELYANGSLEKYDRIYDMERFKNDFKELTDFMVMKTTAEHNFTNYRDIYKEFLQKGLSLDEYQPPEIRQKLEEENKGRMLSKSELPWM